MEKRLLRKRIAATRDYLASPEGQRNVRAMMLGYGWPWERAIAESVMKVTRVRVYERIEEITDALIDEVLAEAAS